ncbi:MAG: hypothetical protein JKY67_12145 [Pseudomonadales bacterium]|nr:hypothetical protein [Pseudomonadales bacterium]
MVVCFCLKKILIEYNLDIPGVQADLAEALNICPNTAAGLYHGKFHITFTTEKLTMLCNWLISLGVNEGGLPAKLFASSTFVNELLSKEVDVYIRQYQSAEKVGTTLTSTEDLNAINELTRTFQNYHCLSTTPFFVPNSASRAKKMFTHLREQKQHIAVVLGGPDTNLVTEFLVADILDRKPFTTADLNELSYHLETHPYERQSCFGQPILNGIDPAIHFRNEEGEMDVIRYKPGVQDAGVIIVSDASRRDNLEIILMGLTGRATLELGRYFFDPDNIEQFWPLSLRNKKKRVSTFICKMSHLNTRKWNSSANMSVQEIPYSLH